MQAISLFIAEAFEASFGHHVASCMLLISNFKKDENKLIFRCPRNVNSISIMNDKRET